MATKGTKQRKVLITGASGTIGTLLSTRLADTYDLVLHGGRAPKTPEQEKDKRLQWADLGDYPALLALMKGVDTVIHLAGAASPVSTWDDVLTANLAGFRNTIEAAREAGVRRFVFASSNHAMGGYDRAQEWPVYPGDLPRPDSLYGVSKAFGETLGRFYHEEHGIDFIALRIGWLTPDPMQHEAELLHAMWLSENDGEQVIRCAIEAKVTYGVYYAISDNQNRRWDITNTMLELGYRPRDSWTDRSRDPEQIVEGGADTPDGWPKNS